MHAFASYSMARGKRQEQATKLSEMIKCSLFGEPRESCCGFWEGSYCFSFAWAVISVRFPGNRARCRGIALTRGTTLRTSKE